MRAGWKDVELGEILLNIKGGGTPSKNNPDYWGGNIPWCSVKDMQDDKFLLTSTQDFITELGLKSSSSNLIRKGTVVTSTRMGLGRAFISDIDIAINQDLKALYPTNELNNNFLLWLIIYNRSNLESLGTGSTVKGIRLETLKSLKIKLPPLPIQKKIASILSAYDDLIENNLKRIKLLEEKAQLTYEEWFVKMRFPGYETAKFDEITGLPEGWEKKAFSNIVNVNPKTIIKTRSVAPYIPMSSISENSMIIEPIEYKSVSGGMKFKNGDTLFARITPCLENGKTGFVQFMEDDDMIAFGSTEYIVLRETTSIGKYFIYCTSREERFRENAIKSMVGSDGRQRVKTECFDKYFVNYAPSHIRGNFENFADNIFRSIQIFVNQNHFLKEARDILLPRLMSGMIDVEELQTESFKS